MYFLSLTELFKNTFVSKTPPQSHEPIYQKKTNLFSRNQRIFSSFAASLSCQSMKSDATTIPSSLSKNSCQEGISLMLLPLLPMCVVRHVAQTAQLVGKDISQCSRAQLLQTLVFIGGIA